jgi:hypothetical protein
MRSWALAAVGLVVAVGVMGAPACGDDSGNPSGTQGSGGGNGGGNTSLSTSSGTTSSSSGSGGTVSCGDFLFNPDVPECQPCAFDNCCAETEACNQQSDCWALLQCIGTCLDQACVDTCNAQFPNGETALNAFTECTSGSCQMECGYSSCPDNAIGYPPEAMEEECNSCVDNNCCEEFTALSTPCIAGDQTACDAAVDALNECLNDEAAATCTGGDPNGLPAAQCQKAECGDVCPAPICNSGYTIKPIECATCLGACDCAAFTACNADANCNTCLISGGQQGNNCDQDANFNAAQDCFMNTCGTECG